MVIPGLLYWECLYVAIAPGTVGKNSVNGFGVGIRYKEKKTPTTFQVDKIYDLGKLSTWDQ